MTPGARVAAAIGVLDAWLSGESIDRALTGWARGARYAGSKDRAAVRDHVYDVLRRAGSCAAAGGGEEDEEGEAVPHEWAGWVKTGVASVQSRGC